MNMGRPINDRLDRAIASRLGDKWRGVVVYSWTEAVAEAFDDESPSVVVRIAAGELQIMHWDRRFAGCPVCLDTRQRLADPDGDTWRLLEEKQVALVAEECFDEMFLKRCVSCIEAAAEALCAISDGFRNRVVVRVSMRDFGIASNKFLPDPLCDNCGGLPEDAEEFAVPNFDGVQKSSVTTYRSCRGGEMLSRLKDAYLDGHCGLIHSLERDRQGGMVVAVAKMALRRHNWVEPGFGRSDSYGDSEAIAILEAIERYGGVQPGGRRTAVVASLRELGCKAVDPRLFGVHPDDTYQDPSNYFHRFDPDARYKWVWGYSLSGGSSVLVPESIAYYYIAHDTVPGPFVSEVSNGCAIGTSLEEAILYGLLEVAERDGFLMTWYRHLALPRIRIPRFGRSVLGLRVKQVERESGYAIEMYDQTMDNGIPAVLVRAKAPEGVSGPAQVLGSAAHPSQEHAALSALAEVGPFLRHMIESYEAYKDDAERMAADPSLVRSMEDHSRLFASRRTLQWLDFLDEGPEVELGAVRDDCVVLKSDTLIEDLDLLIDRYRSLGQDVVYVDQTTPEHEAAGLRCVKVLVTDSLNMSFGAEYRRTDGVGRLVTLPSRIGIEAMVEVGVETRPHPFP